jgi:hypothetical protein
VIYSIQAVQYCEHGKVRAWRIVSDPEDPVPLPEWCFVCDQPASPN